MSRAGVRDEQGESFEEMSREGVSGGRVGREYCREG